MGQGRRAMDPRDYTCMTSSISCASIYDLVSGETWDVRRRATERVALTTSFGGTAAARLVWQNHGTGRSRCTARLSLRTSRAGQHAGTQPSSHTGPST